MFLRLALFVTRNETTAYTILLLIPAMEMTGEIYWSRR